MNNLLFSDSKLVNYLFRLGDLILLNLCFLLCCLPLVTIGAATSALYAVCFRFGTVREERTLHCFFRSFRENLRQATPFWLADAAGCFAASYLALGFYADGGQFHYAFIPFLVLLALHVMVFSYVFPLLALFENSWRGTLRNAFILSIGHLPRSVCVAGLNVLPFVLFLFHPTLFMRIGILWFFLYFSASAYVNTLLLRSVFAPFLPKDSVDSET